MRILMCYAFIYVITGCRFWSYWHDGVGPVRRCLPEKLSWIIIACGEAAAIHMVWTRYLPAGWAWVGDIMPVAPMAMLWFELEARNWPMSIMPLWFRKLFAWAYVACMLGVPTLMII